MKLKLREIIVFALLGSLMLLSKLVFEPLPNVHLLAVLTVVYTVCYRQKALYPIYLFVFLTGLYAGFNLWWIPYLYLWALLWGAAMLLPRSMPPGVAIPVYMLLCGLHGLLYGTMYAPAQALMYGLDLRGTLTWIAAGLPFDALHGVSNFCMGILVLPLTRALRAAEQGLRK
ncbi:MAG: hypothetical protein IJU41_05440 [Clostridia bacterium]|nr:hypothetical protein [Clostridia bacterium]